MLFRSDRKSTRLNSSHTLISYAVFCLKKKKPHPRPTTASREHGPRRLFGEARRRGRQPARRGGPRASRPRARCSRRSAFFFLKDRAPPGISPFPPPAALPT